MRPSQHTSSLLLAEALKKILLRTKSLPIYPLLAESTAGAASSWSKKGRNEELNFVQKYFQLF